MSKISKSIPTRMLCILLTAMLLFGMLPLSAFSASTDI